MEPIKQKAIVVGAGGLGREVAAMIESSFSNEIDIIGFVDDGKPSGESINGYPVLGGVKNLVSWTEPLSVYIGIGVPSVRKRIVEHLSSNLHLKFPNLIHPFARIHSPSTVQLGRGNIICDGVILTTNIQIGNFNLINLTSTIGHDTTIGDFNSIMPSVNVSGGAQIKNEAFIGTGAKLIKSTELKNKCVVGAGAVVTKDIPIGEVWGGVPAKKLSIEE